MSLAASLPPLPIHLSLVAKLAANLAAMEQINLALGTNITSSTSASQLRLSIQSLSLHLKMLMPMVQIPPHQLAAVLNLGSTLASISQFRTSFGIDLLAPTVAVQLRAALQARLVAQGQAGSISASTAAQLAAYSQLAAAAQAAGGLPNLIPTLRLMANLQLPMPSLLLMNQISTIMALQQMSLQIQSVLGLNPLSVNLAMMLRERLQPLSLVESLSASAGAASGGASPISATLAAQISALARMNLRALIGLKIPSLAPLQLLAQFATSFPVTSTSACGPNCPVFG
jgi:hypothetical protein